MYAEKILALSLDQGSNGWDALVPESEKSTFSSRKGFPPVLMIMSISRRAAFSSE